MMRNQRGNLTMVMILSVAILVSLTGVATMTSNLQSKVQWVEHRLRARGVEFAVRVAVTNQVICNCHFNPAINPAASSMTLNTTISPPAIHPNIDIPDLRSGCSFAPSYDNVLATTDVSAPDDKRVSRIQLRDLKQVSPNQFSGLLEIETINRPGEPAIAPIGIPINLGAASSGGTPSARPIQNCNVGAPAISVLPTCPAGFSMVGPPDTVGSYCIDTNPRPAKLYNEALGECYNLSAGLNPYLCAFSTRYIACQKGVAPLLSEEWLSNFWFSGPGPMATVGEEGKAMSIGPSSCAQTQARPFTDVKQFRCCLFP